VITSGGTRHATFGVTTAAVSTIINTVQMLNHFQLRLECWDNGMPPPPPPKPARLLRGIEEISAIARVMTVSQNQNERMLQIMVAGL
jgi:hypothetical protein